MKSDLELRDSLKKLVLSALKDMETEKLVGEVIKEALAEIIHSTLIGMAGRNSLEGTVEMESQVPVEKEFSVPVEEECAIADLPVLNTAAEAFYLYGIAESSEKIHFGPVGIKDGEVYTVPCDNMLVIVQDCSPEPFVSEDDEEVKRWLYVQQEVLDLAQEKLGSVLPMGFNTIIHMPGEHPIETVNDWVMGQSERLRETFHQVRGRSEYGIQVLIEEETLKHTLLDENQEFQKLKQEAESKPEGARYMYRQRLEKVAQEAIEDVGERYFREVYEAINDISDDLRVEKVKKEEDGLSMIANLSCLVAQEKAEELGRIAGEINAREGFEVRFTGPWPPYSFVDSLSMPKEKSMKV
ncbi:MAG TPA: GvpL/GvpF family gas vesicle protein [Desulfosporosinus sp.]|nr:GvpL/GvpF family gas vesicle protein [Desulfosporosinus sp.]